MDRNDDPPEPAQSGTARRQALVASFGARALEGGLGLDALLAEATSHAAEGLCVKRAKVLQHRPEADDLLVRAGVGWKPGVVGHATLPTGLTSPPGRTLRTGVAVALEDVCRAEGFEWSGLLREHGVVSLLNVPVRVLGEVWGVLEVDAEAPRRFSPEHEHFLLSLAGLLGAAIRRLEVEAELRAAGTRAEALAAERAAVLGQLAEGVIVTDAAGRITFINEAAARIHGDAVLGVPPEGYTAAYRLLTEDGRPHPPEELPLARAVLLGETVTGARWRIRRPDGSQVLAAGSARPVLASDGTRIGAVLTLGDETARDVAERALRESEARFRGVFDQQFQFMAVLSPEGVTLEINELPLRAAGITRDEVVGRPFWETPFWSELPAMREAWPGRLAEAAQTEGPVLSEDLYEAAGGEVRTADAAVTAVRGPDGGVRFFVIQATDTTARRRAEAALRASEALKGAILASALDCVVTVDRESRVVDWNPAAERTFGHAREAALGSDMAELIIPPELRGAHRRGLAHYLATGEGPVLGQRIEVEALRADGSRFPAELAITPTSVDGRTLFTAYLRDITDRKAAEAALRELNATLEVRVAERTRERNRVWELSRDLLAVMGLDGRLKAVNPAWSELLGRDEAALLAVHFSELVHPDDDAVTGIVAALRRGEVVNAFEDRLRRADGNYVTVSWTAVPEGDVFYVVGRDVTREREREEQLRQAQKMEALGQLTGGIAHDFNNLLQGIVGALHMLQSRAAAGRTAEFGRYVDAALTSADRAAALTHRLLAFARRQPLDPRPVDVNWLVASLEDLVRRTVGPAIEVETVLAGGLWPTLCDAHQLENALLNLCINARDAMPGGGRLTIETANAHLDDAYAAALRDLSPGQYVALCVTDTGAGMAPDVLARAFDPFFTTKPLGQGTGLGLSMVHGFARQSGGHVRIYSEEGRGTTVKLYLPRHRGKVPTEDEERARTLSPAPGAGATAGATVLVVEDEPIVRALVVEVLEGMGYVALEAADGPCAVRALRAAPRIDLLVTDVGLPGGMNGRQLAEAARGARPGLKVLFITGYAENAAFSNGILEPGMRMMTKPFALDALAAKVRAMIEGA